MVLGRICIYPATYNSTKYNTLKTFQSQTPKNLKKLLNSTDITLERYITLTKNNNAALCRLLLLTTESFESYKAEFEKAIKARDQKDVGALTHKIKMTLELLQANRLQEAIKSAKTALEKQEDKQSLDKIIKNIQDELNVAIAFLKRELEGRS
jgi:HPt (histidine-containing phosphotransfer) domain-containing protein